MKALRVLVTGAGGQLGHDCREILAAGRELAALASDMLDISDPAAVRACVQQYRPQVIVNCAAYTQVDLCETERDKARAVNAYAPALLAAVAADCGARLVHISTDYVFAGDRTPPAAYRESDPTGPVSWYGRTKLEGEQAVLGQDPRHIVLRTAWVYGIHGRNFLKTMLRLALADPGRTLKVVDDQHGSLTWSGRLAEQIAVLLDAPAARGLYHATADGHATWYEVAKTFLGLMEVPHRLIACSSADYPTPARRPGNSILANDRLRQEGLDVMRDWRRDLEEFSGRFRDRLLEECRPRSN